MSLPALIAALLVAGCGGGDSGNSASSSSSSSADFVAEGSQICREDNAKFKELEKSASTADVRDFLAMLVPLLDQDLARLKGLTPPSDKADVYDAWISDLEQTTESARKAQGASSSDAATAMLRGNLAIDKQADAKAKELGLDECLTGSGSSSG
jgi:hypothetical protein